MTYAGYKGYLKSYTDDFLEHSRVKNHDVSTHMYKKGDWEPIISEERWHEVQRLCEEKSLKVNIDGNNKVKGKRKTEDVWLRKLRCSCGSTFRRNKWRTNKTTQEVVFGYQCYNQVNNGSIKLREKYGLDIDGYCSIPMVGDWKLHFMAKTILEALWLNRQDAVDEAIQLIKDNYVSESNSNIDRLHIANLEKTIARNESRIKQLLEMRMDNEITKDEYIQLRERLEFEIQECKMQLEQSAEVEEVHDDLDAKLKEIKQTLEMMIDFSGNQVDEDIIDKLVHQVIPIQKDRFKWVLNLLNDTGNQIVCGVVGRKNAPAFSGNLSDSLPLFQPSTGCY
jgi:hypothetical protein